MKLLFLLENTNLDNRFAYTRAVVKALAADGHEPKIAFTTGGTPADHAYQLMKDHVVHPMSQLCFHSTDAGYVGRLARHLEKYEYDALVVGQSAFVGTASNPVRISDVFETMEKRPRLIFVGHDCSASVSQSVKEIAHLEPSYVAVSQNVASRFMPEVETQVIYGPAVEPEALGADIRDEFGISKTMKIIGYFGNVDEINVDLLLEAAKRLKCGVLVAGTGERIPYLSGVNGPVKVVPAMPMYRGDWFKAIDCFVYPVRSSGFPMIALEAMMAGCPVAMTPVSDMYQLLGGKGHFFGMSVEEMVKAIAGAVKSDTMALKQFAGETFTVERMLSDWNLLLS